MIQLMTRWWQLKYFLFSPRSQFDEHIFQRGWNQQLDEVLALKLGEWLLKYVLFKVSPPIHVGNDQIWRIGW